MTYSKTFERDWNFYSTKDCDNFRTERDVKFNSEGKSAKEIFYRMDTHGLKDLTTCQPDLLRKAITAKECVNMQIKMWSEGIAQGVTFYFEVEKWIDELNYPEWSKKAVENQAKRMIQLGKPYYLGDRDSNGKVIEKWYLMINGEIV